MRSQSTLCIDAGYLLAAAATRVTGSSLRRAVRVDYPTLLGTLSRHVEEQSGLTLLRAYWYDAVREGSAVPEHEQVALSPRVKLRLGRIGFNGEQKGVDLRIGLDMVGHARNGTVDMIYLISGDDDLTEAVEEAQAHGVQVVVLGVADKDGVAQGISRHLARAADEVLVIPDHIIVDAVQAATVTASAGSATSAGVVQRIGQPPSPADVARRAAAPAPNSFTRTGASSITSPISADAMTTAIEAVSARTLDAWAATAAPLQWSDLAADRPTIPRELDRALLVDLSNALGLYDLDDAARVALRAGFWVQVDRRGVGSA
ncbi:NYN domain-containing protein [Curtobacterium flaccumfaciens]|uniref:NYN domain-containing protein n=1 Tax=Curtobacterium flaccumfaciens TaxID=2035 RepID=UPI003991C461